MKSIFCGSKASRFWVGTCWTWRSYSQPDLICELAETQSWLLSTRLQPRSSFQQGLMCLSWNLEQPDADRIYCWRPRSHGPNIFFYQKRLAYHMCHFIALDSEFLIRSPNTIYGELYIGITRKRFLLSEVSIRFSPLCSFCEEFQESGILCAASANWLNLIKTEKKGNSKVERSISKFSLLRVIHHGSYHLMPIP